MSWRTIESDVEALESEHSVSDEVSLDDALRAYRAVARGDVRSAGAYLRPSADPPPVLAPVSSEGFLLVDPVPGRGAGIDVARLSDQARTEARGLFRNALDLDPAEARDVLAEAAERERSA